MPAANAIHLEESGEEVACKDRSGILGQSYYYHPSISGIQLINFLSGCAAVSCPGLCSSIGLFENIMSRGIDFKKAVRSHVEWTARLRIFIAGREHLEADIVSRDDRCPLGHWIYGEGLCCQHLDEYTELKNLHAKFHRSAARIVTIAVSGNTIAVAKKLEFGSDFRNVLDNLINVLHRMEIEAASHHVYRPVQWILGYPSELPRRLPGKHSHDGMDGPVPISAPLRQYRADSSR